MHVATHANIQLRWKSRDGTIIICKLLYRRTCKAVWINDSSSRNQLTIERYRWNNLSTSGKLVDHRSSTDEPFSLSREREKERLRESRIKVKSRSSVLLSSRISSSRMIVTRVGRYFCPIDALVDVLVLLQIACNNFNVRRGTITSEPLWTGRGRKRRNDACVIGIVKLDGSFQRPVERGSCYELTNANVLSVDRR